MAEIEQAPRRDGDPANAVSDPQTDLKKRARRRLVGATALALLAVIILPMVMDQEPKQAVQDIQVRIPSQDSSTFTSRILPSKPAATPLPPVQPQLAPAVVPPEAAAPAKPEAATAAAKPAEPVAKVEKIAEKPAEKAPEKPAAKADDARAKAILDGGGSGQWIIQLGAYQEQGNVRVLQNKVKELGYSSYTEKVSTAQGQRIRVRAGPFASREAAEKAQARLKKIGAGGSNGGVVATK